MNYTFNRTNHNFDGDTTPLDESLEKLRICLNMINDVKSNKVIEMDTGLSDAGFTDDIKEALVDPATDIALGAWGFMGHMFKKFEELTAAMIDTTVALIITLRVCAIIAVVLVSIFVVWRFLKRCNNCANSCEEKPRKSSRGEVYYDIPMKPIIGNKR